MNLYVELTSDNLEEAVRIQKELSQFGLELRYDQQMSDLVSKEADDGQKRFHMEIIMPKDQMNHKKRNKQFRKWQNWKKKRSKISKSCASCGIRREVMNVCSRCHLTRYCSRSCQKLDWEFHKNTCE